MYYHVRTGLPEEGSLALCAQRAHHQRSKHPHTCLLGYGMA